MYCALYARQSVERTDSISIESQLEYCRYEARGAPYRQFIDRGYSGKDTHRPAFAQMLAQIRQGVISKVIVYKLDRISRSILDFTNMMDLFQRYHVEFVSSTERFDTSTPIGRAMLHICMVFAQLERETIQKRVSDAYAARCKRGLYMGGRIPYGFSKTGVLLDGVHTAMYVPVAEEAEQIRLMYALYADPANSLGDIVRYFQQEQIRPLRGGVWTTGKISALLRNPIYVRADKAVYEFFRQQGAVMVNPAEEYTGRNGCYLYRGQPDGEDTAPELVLAPHEGIVDASDWLACRTRCLQNRQSTRTCKAKNSWLCGKVKCGRCGYSLSIVKSNTRWQRYFVCSCASASKKTACPGTGSTIYADVLEQAIQTEIIKRLEEFWPMVQPVPGRMTAASASSAANPSSLPAPVQAKQRPKRQRLPHSRCSPAQFWQTAAFADRQAIADLLIARITAADGKIAVTWNL